MRNELNVPALGKPIQNNVLVEVTDIFDEFKTAAGIHVVNAAHEDAWADSKEYKISNFFIRHGRVVSTPDKIVPDSFDFIPEIEIQEGDVVYWNIIAFKGSQPLAYGNRKFLLVHYKELLLRVRNGQIKPINGNCVFSPVKEEHKFGVYTNVVDKTNKWVVHTLPDKLPVEMNPRFAASDIWEVGDTVYLKVNDKPFKLEGDFLKQFDEELYVAPVRMILCEA